MASDRVAALAFLKVNWERGQKDYLDNFVPLVAEVLRTSTDDIVALPSVQKGLRDRFGIALPLHPLNNVINRTARAGYLRRSHGVYYRAKDVLARTGFETAEAEVRAIH